MPNKTRYDATGPNSALAGGVVVSWWYVRALTDYGEIDMAVGSQPAVFVSSTCYDLAQVRQDLRRFIESLGMEAVMSECYSFPVDPRLNTVANCLAGVKDRADVLVLVVGGRYGSETDSGKSVTNLEYLEAKVKAIPRYVFVQKGILSNLPVWQKNPSADFASVVDTPKLFEFVQSLRDPKESWVFPFESAQDIIDTLRTQLAYLFKTALDTHTKVMRSSVSGRIHDLSGPAWVLALQKPFAWEHRLFSQVLADEIARSLALKRDFEYGIVLGHGRYLTKLEEFIPWVQARIGEVQVFTESANKLFSTALPTAIGAPGEAGNVDDIIYVAQRLGQVYRRLLEWSAELRQIQVAEEFAGVLGIVSRASRNVIGELEAFSGTLQEQLDGAISQYEETKEPTPLRVVLTMTCPDMTDLHGELRRLAERFGVDY